MTSQARFEGKISTNSHNVGVLMPKKSSYERLKSNARVTAYFTEAERDWIDDNLVEPKEPRTEYVRRLIYEDAIRKGLEPPFEVKRLSSE